MKRPMEKARSGWIFWRRRPIGRCLNRALALLLAVGLVFPALGFAFDGSAFGYGIGWEQGDVSRVLQSVSANILPDLGCVTSSHQGSAGRMVVFVHDLHCHYEVQSHIAKILERLARCHDLRLVGVEGDSRLVDVDKLATLPIRRVKTDVAEYFLKRGYITGVEYAAITGNFTLELQGVESPELYAAEKSALDGFLNYASQGLCEELRYAFQKIKPSIYSLDLAKLDHMKESYERCRVSREKYGSFLRKEARRRGLVSASSADLIRSGWPDAEEENVKLQCREKALREALYLSPQQRELDNCLYRLTIMENMISISAAPQELAYFRSHAQECSVKTLVVFLKKWSSAGGLDLDLDPGVGELDQYLESARKFYSLADTRSQAFVQNLLEKMGKKNQRLAVLVAGGFHAALVEQELKRQNVSFISVKPRLTRPDIANPYFALLSGRRTPLEKMLREKEQYFKTASLFNDFTTCRLMDVVSKINILKFLINQGKTGKETLKKHFQRLLSSWQGNDESVQVNLDSAWTDPARKIFAFKVQDGLNGNCFWIILRPSRGPPAYPCVDSQVLEGNGFAFDVVKADVVGDEKTLAKMIGPHRQAYAKKPGWARVRTAAEEWKSTAKARLSRIAAYTGRLTERVKEIAAGRYGKLRQGGSLLFESKSARYGLGTMAAGILPVWILGTNLPGIFLGMGSIVAVAILRNLRSGSESQDKHNAGGITLRETWETFLIAGLVCLAGSAWSPFAVLAIFFLAVSTTKFLWVVYQLYQTYGLAGLERMEEAVVYGDHETGTPGEPLRRARQTSRKKLQRSREVPVFILAYQLYVHDFIIPVIEKLLRLPGMSRIFKYPSLAAYRAAAREAEEKLQRPPPGYYIWSIFTSARWFRFLEPLFYPAVLVQKGHVSEAYGWIFTIAYLSFILALLSPAFTTFGILAIASFMAGVATLNFHVIRKVKPHTKLDMSVTDAMWSGPCNLSLSPVHILFKLVYELTKGTYKYFVAWKSKTAPPLFHKAVIQAYGTGVAKLVLPLAIIIMLGMLFAPQVAFIFATSWSLGSGGYMFFNSGPRMYYYFCFLFAYLNTGLGRVPGLDKFSLFRERKKNAECLTNENIAEFMVPLFTGLQARHPGLYPEKPHFGVLPSEKLQWGQAFGTVGHVGNDGTILLNPNLLELSHNGQMAVLKYFLDIQAGRSYYAATLLEYLALARIFHRMGNGFLHPSQRDALGMIMLGAIIGLGAGVAGLILGLAGTGLAAAVGVIAAAGLMAGWGAYNYSDKQIRHSITLDGPGTFHKHQLASLMARQYGYSYLNVEFIRRTLAWKVLEVQRRKGLDGRSPLTPARRIGLQKIISGINITSQFNSRTGENSMLVEYEDANGKQHRDQPEMEAIMQPEVKAMVKRIFTEDMLRDPFSRQVDQCLMEHAVREKNLIVVGHRRTPSFRLFENQAKKAARFYVIDHNPKEAAHPHPDAILLDMRYLPVPEAIKLVNKALLRERPETKTERFRNILQKKGDAWIGLAGMENILGVKQIYGKDVARVLEQDISDHIHRILDTAFMRRLNGQSGFREIERFGVHGRAAFLMDHTLPADTVSTALQHVQSVLAQEFEEKYVLVRPAGDGEKTITLQQLEAAAARLCETMGDDQLVRVLQDELHGTRLLLRVNRHDLGQNYLEILSENTNIFQNGALCSRPGRLLHQVVEQSLGLKLEPITLQAISQSGPERPINQPAGCGEFLPAPEIVFGVTKASLVYSEPRQRELNQKQRERQLTSRELAEWVEASLFRARYFLRRAQANRHKKVVTDQGKLKPIVMPNKLPGGGKGLFSFYYLKKIRALQKCYAINSDVKNADGYRLYEKTAPWVLTFFGLERLVIERLNFLSRLKKFAPSVFISRAPPRHVYDKEKIRIVVVCPEITHLLDIEYKIAAPEINPCHPWVLPALLMHIEQEQLARLLVVRDLNEAAPLFLQTLEERINRYSKFPITLSAVSGNCPTKDLTREEGFSRLIQKAGLTRLAHPWPEPYAAYDSGRLEAARERFHGIAGKLANDWLQKWSRKPQGTRAQPVRQDESTPLINLMEHHRELNITPQSPGPGQWQRFFLIRPWLRFTNSLLGQKLRFMLETLRPDQRLRFSLIEPGLNRFRRKEWTLTGLAAAGSAEAGRLAGRVMGNGVAARPERLDSPPDRADAFYPASDFLASQEAEARLQAGYSEYQRILHRGEGPAIAEYAFRLWKQLGGPGKFKGKYTLVTDIDGLQEDITAYFTRRMEIRPEAAQIYRDFLENIRLVNIPAGEQTLAALKRMAAFHGMIILSGQYQNTVRIEMDRAGKVRFFAEDDQPLKLDAVPGLRVYFEARRRILQAQARKTRDGLAVCWFTPSQVITHASRKLKAGGIMFINYCPKAHGWKDGVDLDRLAGLAKKQSLESDMHASVGAVVACLADNQAAQAAFEQRVREEQSSGRVGFSKDEAEAIRRTHYRDDLYRIAVFRKGPGPVISEEALQEPFSDSQSAAAGTAGRSAGFSGFEKEGIRLPGEETGAADIGIAARKKVSRLVLLVLALVMGSRALKKAGQHSLHLKLGVAQRKLPGALLVILLMRQPAFWKAVKDILKVVNGRAWHAVPENVHMKKQWHDGRKLIERSSLFLWILRITHTQADEIDHHLKMIIYHANKIKGTAFYLAPGRYLQEVMAADPELHDNAVISRRIRERFLNQDAWLMRALGRLDNSPQNGEMLTSIMHHLMKEMRRAKLAGDQAYRDHILLIFRHIDPANQQVMQFRAGREDLIKRVIPARLLQDDLLKEQLMTLYDDEIFYSNGQQLRPPRRIREISLSYAGAA